MYWRLGVVDSYYFPLSFLMDPVDFNPLTVKEILNSAKPFCFPRATTRSKPLLVSAVAFAPEDVQTRVTAALQRKRSQPSEIFKRTVKPRVAGCCTDLPDSSGADAGDFLRPATDVEVKQSIMEFIDRTSNLALATRVCGVCARVQDSHLCKEHDIAELPHRERLVPSDDHPEQNKSLFNGLLLHPPGVRPIGQDKFSVTVCTDCYRDLKADKVQTQPHP